jgi:chromosome partitioning protein
LEVVEEQYAPVGVVSPSRRLSRTVRILSAGAKGGPGKSFLVKNLSGAAAAEGYNVAVVDFDKQRTLTKWLGRRERFYADGPKIFGYEGDPSDPSDASAVVQMTDHDFIFIDTPPSIDQHSAVLKTLAYSCELVLVPSKVGISDTESAEVLLASLAEWAAPTMAILNLVKPSAKRVLQTAQRRLVRVADLCAVEIGDYTDFLTADEGGVGATEMRKCGGAVNIDAVWAAVCRKVAVGRYV